MMMEIVDDDDGDDNNEDHDNSDDGDDCSIRGTLKNPHHSSERVGFSRFVWTDHTNSR